MKIQWWMALAVAVTALDCRLIAGYEDLELSGVSSGGGTGQAGDGGHAGSVGGGGSGGSSPYVTITTLTATPGQVVGTREVEIAWEVDNAESCEFDEGLGEVAPYFGSLEVSPSTTTTYTLTCQGPGGPASQDVTVDVFGVTMLGGGSFTCARSHNNVLDCFGANGSGQLGRGDTLDRGDEPGEMGDALVAIDMGQNHNILAAAVGEAHGCGVLDDNNVKCWGNNDRGQLGLGDTLDRGDEPGEMGEDLEWATVGGAEGVAAGGHHSCARLLNGSVKCWGANHLGQLGIGDDLDRGDGPDEMQDLPTVPLGGHSALAVVAGANHSCALLDDHTVKCWGGNQYGQLGQERQDPLGDSLGELDALPPIALGANRTAVALAAGSDHTCALLDNNRVKCWGRNDRGQLGTADPDNHGDAPGTMGAQLPEVALGTGRTAQAIAAGGAHNCALTDNDRIKCWGANDRGQLGQGDTVDRGQDANTLGDSLDFVELGSLHTAQGIAAGGQHSCVILDDGTVRCWGANDHGQLGVGDALDRGVVQGQMGDSLTLVDITP